MQEALFIFLVAASPVVELRGAIPLALLVYELPFWQAIFLSITGNMVPVLLLPFLGVITSVLSQRFSLLERYFTWLFLRTRRKHKGKFETLQDFALVAFVAIPLPFTGVWTAMIAAFVFDQCLSIVTEKHAKKQGEFPVIARTSPAARRSPVGRRCWRRLRSCGFHWC